MTDRLSLPELESHLWGAATILRGLVDAGDYKQFIFPLLFYKRLSDVWDEEYAQALTESGDAAYAAGMANERFIVPAGAHWNDVRETPKDVGQAIQNALRSIEAANPDRLDGIFGDAPWTNKERLPDRTLKNLLEHFSQHTLSIANVPEDELGNAYEYLIKQFADDSGHTAQEFYTNRTVVHLMVQMLDPQPGEKIYDPTCGTGGMLISALDQVKRGGGEYRTLKLYGQERNHMTASIARMNLALHGVDDFAIARGDTLERPAFTERDRLATFDVVLANPPYSIKQWDREAWTGDPWGRNFLGTPPQGRADYAFFQHILKSLDPKTGRCAILFPHGVLFRKEEADMRQKLVDADLVDCVLGLGPNLFYNSPMEACIVVCRTSKVPERRGRVLFINAVDEVTRERSMSYLKPEHLERIANAYHNFKDVEGFAKVASVDEICLNDGNLSIPLYVRGQGVSEAKGEYAVDGLKAAVIAWEESSERLNAAVGGLLAILE
jgi:type I restriction enzyme M protein